MNTQFQNFWNVNLFARHNFRAFDDLDTRGGPPIVTPAETFLNVFVGSDSRETWRVNLGLSGGRDERGGWNARIGPFVRLQPSGQLQVSVGTNYSFGQDVAQWLTNEDVTGDGATDFVYGQLRRDVIDVTGRATYAFHRDLTLQVFVQPFVAVGDYTDIRRLARPASFEFEPATIFFDPDFNRTSLRGNMVLRWEYLRGSTLFLVWNISTFDDTRAGVFAPVADLGRAFSADGTHVFTGISDLLALDGTFIHPRAAERTKFCSAHNRPTPEAVTSAHADVEPTGAAAFRAFLRHRSTLVPFRRQPSLHLAARQPAGTGSAQILRSISPKSRRFRCPSASRSQ